MPRHGAYPGTQERHLDESSIVSKSANSTVLVRSVIVSGRLQWLYFLSYASRTFLSSYPRYKRLEKPSTQPTKTSLFRGDPQGTRILSLSRTCVRLGPSGDSADRRQNRAYRIESNPLWGPRTRSGEKSIVGNVTYSVSFARSMVRTLLARMMAWVFLGCCGGGGASHSGEAFHSR